MKKKHLIQSLLIALLLMLFLMLTNPNEVSLPLILVPYILASLLFYRLFSIILGIWFGTRADRRKIKIYSIVLTVVIINFALLKSIGQLTIQDGLISVAIIVISAIYISKFSISS